MSERYLKWYTIPEFESIKPVNLYHKENEEGPGEAAVPANLHVLARAGLEYSEKQGRVFIRITADDYYKLYLNGEFVGQGPAPAYPEHSYYNEIDITPFLVEGENVLAAHLYYQGLINRVWNSGDGRFGIACQIVRETGKEEEPLWKYQISRAYSGDTTGYKTQFLENFDSNDWDEKWNSADYDDRLWAEMVPASFPTMSASEQGYKLSEQPCKMVSVYLMEPEKIVKRSLTERGIESFHEADKENFHDSHDNRDFHDSHDSHRNDSQEVPVWSIDMGQEITGALRIQAYGKKGSKIIIRCGEELSEDGIVRYDMRCNCRYEETWTLREGNNLLEPYDYKGFRYAELILENGAEIRKVEAVVRHYPMDETLCTLKSNGKYLDEIFSICKNGVKFGTQEGYLDCPTREKGQYLGDATVTARSQVWLTGTTELLRKCIDQFAQSTAICPGMMGVAPGSFMQEIADFSLLWSQLLLTDYQFTGDKEFLRKYYPVAKKITDHFKQYEREDGMLVWVKDKWNLVDWPENLRDHYDFTLSRPVGPGCHNVINALYVGAAKTLSWIEGVLGLPKTGDFEKLKSSYIRAFYDEGQQLFTDSVTSRHASLHSNVYALYFGLCPEHGEEKIADFLVEKGFCCGVLLSYYYLKALARIGRWQDVYRLLVNESEHGWVNMLREGATTCFEAWGKDQKWNTSLCHPWASAPVPIVIEEIAGFVPDPECERHFRFEPHIPEEVTEFSLKIPFRGNHFLIEKNRQGIIIEDMLSGRK